MPHTYQPARLFTVEEANAMLPLLRLIVADIVELTTASSEHTERLKLLLDGRETNRNDPYAEEVAQMEEAIASDRQKVRDCVAELEELGVELKDASVGLVDFPWERDGRTAYLCWMLGETTVGHWHELNAGFGGRQPLTP